jgi:beta-galactosidase
MKKVLLVLFGLLFGSSAVAIAADDSSPRQVLSMDKGWKFHRGAIEYDFGWHKSKKFSQGPCAADFNDSAWHKVNVPHDFVIEGTFDPSARVEGGFLKGDIGWYRKKFTVPESDKNKRIYIEFDGVFRNCKVFLNEFFIGSHLSGYTSFFFDVTDFLNYGGENVIAIEVDARNYEGWWYEGGGIYRHVRIVKTDPMHVAPWGIFIRTESDKEDSPDSATVTIATKVLNRMTAAAQYKLTSAILSPQGSPVAQLSTEATQSRWGEQETIQKIRISNPELWSIEKPQRYTLETTVVCDGNVVDNVKTKFGIRTIRIDAEKGFFLNGKYVKIKGVCCHQDHAGVGVALPDRLHEWRIEKLKEMGANAYRCSHNPPAPEILEACDRLGMLVLDENRILSSAPENLEQLESMILRDRNHPSVIMWSLGNEEGNIQGKPEGRRIARSMYEFVKALDPTRPVTVAENGVFNEGPAFVVDVKGLNYSHNLYDMWHRDHPDRPLLATETGSTVTTRGIYAYDPNKGYVHAYDKRESGIHWAPSAQTMWRSLATKDFVMGCFVWTGFDYKGEPTPFAWPCVNSHFGIMDTCGFAKDNYYYYKSWWTDEPVLHLLPHWNWPDKTGQEIAVWCFSNCDEVELSLNGKSLGKKEMPRLGHIELKVPYEPGTLSAKGFKNGKAILTKEIRTTGAPAQIKVIPDRTKIKADGEDIAIATVQIVDEKGDVVPYADNLVAFDVTGNAKIIGVGNGDPSSHEPDKATMRRAFNGLCQVIIQAGDNPGQIQLSAQSDGLASVKSNLEAQQAETKPMVD